MITAADTGQLIVYVTEDPIDDAAVAYVMDMMAGGPVIPVIIDASRARNCAEVERTLAEQPRNRNIVISNLLDAFYDTSILTREAAQVLGRVKSILESLVEDGAQIVVLSQRRTAELGTRSHFMASLCASADRVYFRRST